MVLALLVALLPTCHILSRGCSFIVDLIILTTHQGPRVLLAPCERLCLHLQVTPNLVDVSKSVRVEVKNYVSRELQADRDATAFARIVCANIDNAVSRRDGQITHALLLAVTSNVLGAPRNDRD